MVCQFCLFFSKNQLLALLIFAMVSLVSFAPQLLKEETGTEK